jgi:hypothetical protein
MMTVLAQPWAATRHSDTLRLNDKKMADSVTGRKLAFLYC